ncbi:hypothetical protein FKM82_022774 [Ascaphus truei]
MGKVPNLQGGPHPVWLAQAGQGWFCSDAGAVTTDTPNLDPLGPPEPEIWSTKIQHFTLSHFLSRFCRRRQSLWRDPFFWIRPLLGVQDVGTRLWSSGGTPRD